MAKRMLQGIPDWRAPEFDRLANPQQNMFVMRTGTSRRRALKGIGSLLILLFLALLALAAFPGLHSAIHNDANHPDHHCAITVLLHGQVEPAVCDLPVHPTPADCQPATPSVLSY